MDKKFEIELDNGFKQSITKDQYESLVQYIRARHEFWIDEVTDTIYSLGHIVVIRQVGV